MTGQLLVRPSFAAPVRDAVARVAAGVRKYLLKFGLVGLVGMAVDVSVFNALRLLVGSLPAAVTSPLGASVVSVSCAIVCNWLGNRYWTFRHQRRRNMASEFAEYLAVSLLGMLVALACVWVSHYGLGMRGLLADNIAKNVVGLVLGTAVRFTLIRYWVWGHHRSVQADDADLAAAASTLYTKP